MNQEIKNRWVSALRSGEYKQGKGALCSINNEYCCLGVLSDLYAKEYELEWITKEYKNRKYISSINHGSLSVKVAPIKYFNNFRIFLRAAMVL